MRTATYFAKCFNLSDIFLDLLRNAGKRMRKCLLSVVQPWRWRQHSSQHRIRFFAGTYGQNFIKDGWTHYRQLYKCNWRSQKCIVQPVAAPEISLYQHQNTEFTWCLHNYPIVEAWCIYLVRFFFVVVAFDVKIELSACIFPLHWQSVPVALAAIRRMAMP